MTKHKGYGLAHILDKRKAEFVAQGFNEKQAEKKAVELINKMPQIVEKGKLTRDDKNPLKDRV